MAPEAPAPAKVPDLMAALEASLAAVKAESGPAPAKGAAKAKGNAAAKKPAAAKGSATPKKPAAPKRKQAA